MTLASIADHGWIGLLLLLIFLVKQQIKMLAMRLVFLAYRTSREEQHNWLLREARRNDTVTLARGFWNRASQRGGDPRQRPRRTRAPRRADPAAVAELPGDGREPRLPAA